MGDRTLSKVTPLHSPARDEIIDGGIEDVQPVEVVRLLLPHLQVLHQHRLRLRHPELLHAQEPQQKVGVWNRTDLREPSAHAIGFYQRNGVVFAEGQ